MKPPYRTELEALLPTYKAALGADVAALRAAVHELGRGPALFVGSGGSMALAELCARLHEQVCRQPARSCTSLQALDAPQLERRGALLFSSSAKHPDARRVLAEFQRGRFAPAVLVTHRRAEEVESLAGCDTDVVVLPAPVQPDGFLATGSILQIATLLLRAYLPGAALPDRVSVGESEERPLRREVLVLTPPSLVCAATDIEVRLVESGLAAVQVSDYRNFAHGRHTGFARRASDITVIALSDAMSELLAEGTTGALPEGCDVRRWHADGAWEAAIIELLYRSIRLAGEVGERAGIDVARPAVPLFGRRLYRLPLRRRIPERPTGGVERKLLAAGCGEDEHARDLYAAAAAAWTEEIAGRRFAGIVLDYDGTTCWTQRRQCLPATEIQAALLELLEAGAVIGFASGRGRSLHADLRRWAPRAWWGQVVLGLYNGGVLLRLNDELPELREPTDWSRRVVAVIRGSSHASRVEVTERSAQVSVNGKAVVHDGLLAAVIVDRLAAAGVEASVVSSAHAIDVVPPTSTKVSVADRVEAESGGEVLAIGDQGQVGGNDHALLARGPATLSVDRCSADPVSCWFVGRGEQVGPALLGRYLRSLHRRSGGFTLTGLKVA